MRAIVVRCVRCNWPVCSTQCQDSPLHVPECRATQVMCVRISKILFLYITVLIVNNSQTKILSHIKGSLSRDFRLQVFSWISVPLAPKYSIFEFFWKFAEILAYWCLASVSTTPVIALQQCQWQRQKIYRHCHWHRWTIIASDKNKDAMEVGSCQI